jgi:hypothetical protein
MMGAGEVSMEAADLVGRFVVGEKYHELIGTTDLLSEKNTAEEVEIRQAEPTLDA